MVFGSHIFIFYFLPLVLLLNPVLPFRVLTLMLVSVSYVFYGWANPRWVLVGDAREGASSSRICDPCSPWLKKPCSRWPAAITNRASSSEGPCKLL